MTLVVAIKSQCGLVIAADSMAYYGYGNADIPHRARKLKRVCGHDWLFSFSGDGTVQSIYGALQSQLDAGDLKLDADIRVGGFQYLNQYYGLSNAYSTSLLLAGYGSDEEAYIYVRDLKTGQTDTVGNIFAIGAQQSTAHWIISKLLPESSSLDDVQFLAHFAIEQVGEQELKVGHAAHYPIDVCSIVMGEPLSFATPEQLVSYRQRGERVLSCFQDQMKQTGQQQ